MRQRGQRLFQTVTTALSYDRAILGVITVNNLFWRTLADLPVVAIERYLETINEAIVAPAIISLLTAFDTELQTVALLAEWLFITSLFYLLAPQIFRHTARDITQDERFRLVTAIAALGFALTLAAMLLESPWVLDDFQYFVGFLGAGGLSLGSYGWYFRVVHGWSTRSIGQKIDILDKFIRIPARDRTELRTSSRETHLWARVRVSSVFLALLFICTVSAFFLGLFSVIVLGLFPIVELLVLTSVSLNVIEDRHGLPFGLKSPQHYTLDIEARIRDAVTNTDSSIKGWSTLLLVLVCGLAFQVIGFVSVLPVIRTGTVPFLETVIRIGITSVSSLILAWNTIGVGCSLLIAVIYGIWFWVRMLERVPEFLETWENSVDRSLPATKESETNVESTVTRPVGFMGPPALIFLIALLWSATKPDATTLAIQDITVAIAWPLSLLILIATIWQTLGRNPQAPESDSVAIPLSLLVQFGGIFSFLWFENFGTQQPLAITFAPFVAFLFLLVPWLFFLGDVWQWTHHHESVSEYIFVGYILVLGAGTILIGILGRGQQMSRLFLLFGGMVVVLAGVLALDEYHSTSLEGKP